MLLSLPARRLLLLALVVLLVATACGKDNEDKTKAAAPKPAPKPAPGPFAVGTRTLHFVDESRPLQAAASPPKRRSPSRWPRSCRCRACGRSRASPSPSLET